MRAANSFIRPTNSASLHEVACINASAASFPETSIIP
jgi:hypothetical protein